MYNFTTTSSTRSAEDLDGHGSHTASTIAGNNWQAPFGGGTFSVSGVAPHANVIAYKVCTTGCSSSASSQAANQAVIDGADVLNFSISGGVTPWSDSVSIAFRNAVGAGVFVAASAGNDGPDAGSVNHAVVGQRRSIGSNYQIPILGQYFDNESFLALEIIVERTFGHTGCRRNLLHAGSIEAAGADEFPSLFQ